MDRKLCKTEERNERTGNIDELSTIDMIRLINDEDKKVALAVEREAVETPLGEITKKTGRGWGLIKHKAEFEDLASAARAGKVPLGEVRWAFEENV